MNKEYLLLDEDFPDPAVLLSDNGYYYAYATQHVAKDITVNIQSARSRDLKCWEYIGEVMPEKPSWAHNTQNIWAPDVVQIKNVYYMYFSCAYNSNNDMAIGVALSNNPGGPFIPLNQYLICGEGFKNIDPMFFHDPLSGKNFLYWGSGYSAIKAQELSSNYIEFKTNSYPVEILFPDSKRQWENLIEAPYVIYNAPYYYLFYSGDCCWFEEKYCIMVARSFDPLGPFEKMQDSLNIIDSIILAYNKKWLAPGHNCIVHQEQYDWIIYHAVDKDDKYQINLEGNEIFKRKMCMKKLIVKFI